MMNEIRRQTDISRHYVYGVKAMPLHCKGNTITV